MRLFITILLFPLWASAQIIGVVAQGGIETDTLIITDPTGPPSPITLTLNTLKASPLAEGIGSLSRGAFASGAATTKLGRVTSLSGLAGAENRELAGTFNGYELWEGTLASLWELESIVIIPWTSGHITTGKSYGRGNLLRAYGDYVTYFGQLGVRDNIVLQDVEMNIGCPDNFGGTYERCTGQTENVMFGIKVYHKSPKTGSPTVGDWGLNCITSYGIDNGFFANNTAAYGGDQVWDVITSEKTNNGFPAYLYQLKTTRQHNIIGNSYETGSLIGGTTTSNDVGYDETKNFYVHPGYRVPKINEPETQTHPYHIYNNFTYNLDGFRTIRIDNDAVLWYKNNINRRGPNSRTWAYNEFIKFQTGGVGQLDISGNIDEGNWNYTDNDNPVVTEFQSPGTAIIPANNFKVLELPQNDYYLINTSTASGRDAIINESLNYAGARWATGPDGTRISNIDELMNRFINDAKNGTNSATHSPGLFDSDLPDADRWIGAFIPSLNPTAKWLDTNNNLIADTFETAHSLVADPKATKATWTFTEDGRNYTVQNTAGYTNIEMFAFWISDYFYQLIERGEVATDSSYSITLE